eukprot:scaffold5069_cov115-Isochrysis_galbana.AAC.1
MTQLSPATERPQGGPHSRNPPDDTVHWPNLPRAVSDAPRVVNLAAGGDCTTTLYSKAAASRIRLRASASSAATPAAAAPTAARAPPPRPPPAAANGSCRSPAGVPPPAVPAAPPVCAACAPCSAWMKPLVNIPKRSELAAPPGGAGGGGGRSDDKVGGDSGVLLLLTGRLDVGDVEAPVDRAAVGKPRAAQHGPAVGRVERSHRIARAANLLCPPGRRSRDHSVPRPIAVSLRHGAGLDDAREEVVRRPRHARHPRVGPVHRCQPKLGAVPIRPLPVVGGCPEGVPADADAARARRVDGHDVLDQVSGA